MKATLGVSNIHGIGVIAIRGIIKGEKIFADRLPALYHIPFGSVSKLYPEVKKIILDRWPSVVNGSNFIYPDARLVSFMNHAFTGEGANYDPVTDTATEDISEGQEILEDYTAMPNYNKVYPWLKELVKQREKGEKK